MLDQIEEFTQTLRDMRWALAQSAASPATYSLSRPRTFNCRGMWRVCDAKLHLYVYYNAVTQVLNVCAGGRALLRGSVIVVRV
jgi:hypothetical protein